ncbi:hypothetical protein B296_00044647 [Ensete ventricosum]|uniref:Uncharacterized protein n=1 Tax=Ensete ventricosum TaxID=4639 RepID=A0A426YSR8_ENSVE|nr:hypothetical protein B296_00044647 [Ensete ventricosum]
MHESDSFCMQWLPSPSLVRIAKVPIKSLHASQGILDADQRREWSCLTEGVASTRETATVFWIRPLVSLPARPRSAYTDRHVSAESFRSPPVSAVPTVVSL